MSGFGSFGGGFAQGLSIGDKINALAQEDQIAKVRAQGVAEARAMQAAGTPQVQDQGDMQNLTARPQASGDPAAAPVNTSLYASPAMQGAPQQQTDGMTTVPVPAPSTTDTSRLSSAPLASADPNPSPAVGGMTIKGGKRFLVGDQGFDTIAEAQAHAKSQAPDLYEIMRKTVLPRERDQLLAQGQYEKAAALDKWGQDEDGRAYMKNYAKFVQSIDAGDDEGALKHMQTLHNGFKDGYSVSNITDATDDKGNMIGKSITYKNDKTGEEKTQIMDPQALLKMGKAGLSPEKAFALDYQEQQAATAASAKARFEALKEKQQLNNQLTVEQAKAKTQKDIKTMDIKADAELETQRAGNRQEQAKLERYLDDAGIVPRLRAQVGAKMQMLSESGMSPDEVKAAIPAIVGIEGANKKTTDPTERRAIIVTELAKNPLFSDPKKLAAQVDLIMKTAYGADAPAPGAGKSSPAAAGVSRPAAANPAAGAAPLTMYDPVSKQMVPVQRR